MVRDIHITDRYGSLHLNLLPFATKVSRAHISAKAQQPPLTWSSISNCKKIHIKYNIFESPRYGFFQIKIQALFSEKLWNIKIVISPITESGEKSFGSVPLLGSTPKVKEVYSGLRPILHPSNVKPHSAGFVLFFIFVILLTNQPTNRQTLAKALTFF